MNIADEYFGELIDFVREDKITDITWNGKSLWIDHLERGRYEENVKLTDSFVEIFATRIANLANKNFNASEPLLEAETDDLRISIIDSSVTNTKKSIAIRKTPALRRLNERKMIAEGYAEEKVIEFLETMVKSHMSIIVTGDVGSGKTELIKYLTKFIPDYERTISIEDNFELRLSKINPNLDCVEIRVSNQFDYKKAIKAALRQLCKWCLMSEARSSEVINLLEAASTGCSVMTTIHSDDVRKIPDRVINMMGVAGQEKKNDVYNFFDIGIKVNVTKERNRIHRNISQICVFDRNGEENNLQVLYENYKWINTKLPENICRKIEYSNEKNPLEEMEKYEIVKESESAKQ